MIDRVLLKLGRQEAPVLLAQVDSPVFLLQGVYCNSLGQPTVVEWMAISGLPGEPDIQPMIDVLHRAGVNHSMPNSLQKQDLSALQALVPTVVDAAAAYLKGRRDEYDALSAKPLESLRERSARYTQLTLGPDTEAAVESATSTQIRQTAQAQIDLADRLRTTGDPLLRLLAVLVPQTANTTTAGAQ